MVKKAVATFFMLCVFLINTAQAELTPLTITWEYSGSNIDGGFRLYCFTPDYPWRQFVARVPDPTAREHNTIFNLRPGTSKFVILAYDEKEESEYSDEFLLEYLASPTSFSIQIIP